MYEHIDAANIYNKFKKAKVKQSFFYKKMRCNKLKVKLNLN